MEYIAKLERVVIGWFKNIPHLPSGARRWIGENVWWLTIIGLVLSGIGAIGLLLSIAGLATAMSTTAISYYASSTFVALALVNAIVTLVFVVLDCVLLAMAITPLKEKQKKGWVLLFMSLLLGAISTVVTAILTLSPLSFITSMLFGAIWLAIGAYLLSEIHGEFAHVERSKGVKEEKSAASADAVKEK